MLIFYEQKEILNFIQQKKNNCDIMKKHVFPYKGPFKS